MTISEAIIKLREKPETLMAQRKTQMAGFWLNGLFKTGGITHYGLSEAIVTELGGVGYMRRCYKDYPISDVSIMADDWQVLELPPYTK